jgi:hypothetical protein
VSTGNDAILANNYGAHWNLISVKSFLSLNKGLFHEIFVGKWMEHNTRIHIAVEMTKKEGT